MTTKKTFSELSKLKTFEERFDYLKLDGDVGEETFGGDRYLNQMLYKSKKWRSVRNKVILRDGACDLGIEGHDMNSMILIHHLNPITVDQIINNDPCVFDEDNLICTSKRTHNAIHYGDKTQLVDKPIERKAGDTTPWKKEF